MERVGEPVVVKADGLCGGNGSFVCDSVEDADRAIDLMMGQKSCGAAGDRVVIERKLEGRELSVFALVDGQVVYQRVGKDRRRVSVTAADAAG